MDQKNNLSEIVEKVHYVNAQIKTLHFQTPSYAEHIALGDFYDKFADTSDKLVEVIQGKFGKILFNNSTEIEIYDYSDAVMKECINETEKFFTTEIFTILKGKNTEIENICQEVIGDLQRLKFLLTLR